MVRRFQRPYDHLFNEINQSEFIFLTTCCTFRSSFQSERTIFIGDQNGAKPYFNSYVLVLSPIVLHRYLTDFVYCVLQIAIWYTSNDWYNGNQFTEAAVFSMLDRFTTRRKVKKFVSICVLVPTVSRRSSVKVQTELCRIECIKKFFFCNNDGPRRKGFEETS